MKWLFALLVSTLAVALLAMPAAAQEDDPYSGVLPGGAERPDDVTAPPDGDAVLGAGEVRSGENASASEAVEASNGVVRAAGRAAAPVPSRQLPVTGGELTVTLLALGAALLAAGGGAVALARRRGHAKS